MSILAGASGVVISGNSSINAYSGDVTNNYTHTTNRIKDSFNSNQTSYENSGNDNSQRYNGGGSYSSYSLLAPSSPTLDLVPRDSLSLDTLAQMHSSTNLLY
ncbi:hypothetical protein FA15DRAFT_472731 [Coprinopsis marcescibilis]|uniref:Uncharacterized protein n=1 Tax=Coprinopsis marcescibilis TaxID=230819 RepID=A0A5C3KTM9_COPMA|nr:hypothetical protein FA15DRAFT_472731 [Coprinopsis marcescibilis]